MKDIPVILLFGSPNSERLVSFASAQNLVKHLKPLTHTLKLWFWGEKDEIYELDEPSFLSHQNAFKTPFHPLKKPDFKNLEEALKGLKMPHIWFLALHGEGVEDGDLQKLLEGHQIFFTASGASASADCFDKEKTKQQVNKMGIPVLPSMHLEGHVQKDEKNLKHFLQVHKALVLKPNASGSSDGLFFVYEEEQLAHTLNTILKEHANKVYVAEAFSGGIEVSVGVIEHHGELIALPPTEIQKEEGFVFDYDAKYLGKGVTEITPARISESETKTVQELALKAHQALGCYGYSRTDMILTQKGPVFLEINTLPGLTKSSFIPQQLAALGIDMGDFLKQQLLLALHRYERKP